jgi:predicted RNase H-related nuclease YkuK (DUF458 family)
MKDCWFTGSGDPLPFSELMVQVDDYIVKGGKVFIGTDSQIKSDQCIFVTAICLHGRYDKFYATYFFSRSRLKRKPYQVLRVRIMEEVQHSLDIAMNLMEKHPEAEIEVHVDVGRTHRSATRHFADAINGWVKGVGLKCKMKPDSWASSSIADSHTK